jgi:DNA-binding transcriptional LysR family regulator
LSTVASLGRLHVGFTNASALSPFFPRLIHAYRTQRPKVNITLLELSSSLQIEAIEQREIDVGLLRLPESALPAIDGGTPAARNARGTSPRQCSIDQAEGSAR